MKGIDSSSLTDIARFPGENPNPVLGFSFDGILLYANNAGNCFLASHGLSPGSSCNSPIAECLEKVISSGMKQDFELPAERATYLFSFVPLKEEGYINAYGYDISIRKNALKNLELSEQKLKETTAVLRTILDNTPSLIAYLDRDFNFIMVNRAYAEAYGSTPEFFPGKYYFDLFPISTNEDIFRNCALKGESYHAFAEPMELEVSSERTLSYWDWNLTPLKDEEEKLTGFVLTVVNASERIKAMQKIEEGQKKLDSIISSAMDAIISIDSDFNIILYNETAERLFQHSRKDILGKHVSLLIPHEFRADHDRHIKDFSANGAAVLKKGGGRPHLGLKMDGGLFPFESSVSQTVINGEKIFTIIIRDITERLKAEEILMLNESRFRNAIENLPFIFDIYDAQGRYQYMNASGRKIAKKDLSEIIGKRDQDIFPPEIAAKHLEILEKCIKTRKAQSAEFKITLLNRKMQLVANYIPVLQNHEIYQILGVFFNVTQQKETEESLNKLIDDLNRSNRELEQFAYIASHDLQEPLRMIMWYTGFLSKKYKGRLDPKADEFIYFITSAASRMSSLIRDLLSYGRINAINKPFERVDCNQLLKEVMSIMQPQIEESKAVICFDALPHIKADPTLLRQLWQNLISNSIKFRSAEPCRVFITTEEKRKEWVFCIKDNGIGIEPEYREKIFEIFQQLHEREKYPGTGIGLAICKKIAERHGGRIWVESEPGFGSSFYFSIEKIN